MTPLRTEAALVAALLVSGCAGADAASRRELDALRADVAAAREENRQLARSVESLQARLDAMAARLGRPHPQAEAPSRPVEPVAEPVVVPGGLAVVRVEPPSTRRAPPVPTSVAIVEPDGSRLEALARRGGRDLASEAEAELRAARKRDGLARAHALEDFAARYPRHPQAGAALVESAAAYADAGREEAGCALVRRVVEEYPAGDAVSEALWRVARCEQRGGQTEAERRVLTRLVTEFPSTSAARRAGERLAAITGRSGGESSAGGAARSGP
ncbi:MAG TPA: tetratricopeptide repeat protein [Anaeromyxobacteraceae bacterium]|nr:tetratricopeptide repeat protein [Anaeromyxobacteraceae bacterium]